MLVITCLESPKAQSQHLHIKHHQCLPLSCSIFWLTNQLTNKIYLNSMEYSPALEVNGHLVKKFPPLLWNAEIHYFIHMGPPLANILSQMNPIHTYPSYFLKICSNIVPFKSMSSQWPLPFRISNQIILCISRFSLAFCMPCQYDPYWLDQPNKMWRRLQFMKLLILQSSPASPHFLPLNSK